MSKHLGFDLVGDSISEGYDDNITVSCYGLFGRFQRYMMTVVGTPTISYRNLGVSGRRVNQYIDVAKSIIEADPSRTSAVFVSIWSPNKPTEQPAGTWPTAPENLANMVTWLQDFEAWCIARRIVFIPVFLAGVYSALSTANRVALQGHLDNCKTLWPFLVNFNEGLQDPAYTDGPRMASTWTNDGIHPNQNGYTRQYSTSIGKPLAAYNAAKAFYGVVDL